MRFILSTSIENFREPDLAVAFSVLSKLDFPSSSGDLGTLRKSTAVVPQVEALKRLSYVSDVENSPITFGFHRKMYINRRLALKEQRAWLLHSAGIMLSLSLLPTAMAVVLSVLSTGCEFGPCSIGSEEEREECRAGRKEIYLRYSGVQAASADGQVCYTFRSRKDEANNKYGLIYTGVTGDAITKPSPLRIGGQVVHGKNPVIACSGESMLVSWVDSDLGQESLRVVLVNRAGNAIDSSLVVLHPEENTQPYGVSFDGSQYLVVWQSPASELLATRISRDGVAIDRVGISLGPAGALTSMTHNGANGGHFVQRLVLNEGWRWSRVEADGNVINLALPPEQEGAVYMSNPVAVPQGVAMVATLDDASELVTVDFSATTTTTQPLRNDQLGILQLAAGNDGVGVLRRPPGQTNGAIEFTILEPETLNSSTAMTGIGDIQLAHAGDTYAVLETHKNGALVAWWFNENGTPVNTEPVVLLEIEYLETNY